MLNDFLENNVQNKLHIISILHLKRSISLKELSHELNLSTSGINSIMNELNSELRNLAGIHKSSACFKLFKYKKDVTYTELCHAVYKNSTVLQCLRFFITNEEHKSFSHFIEEKFLTKSSAYRIRQNCSNYLHIIGLNIKNNVIAGNEYRIRFLIALLYYRYGINCCGINKDDTDIVREFVLSTNQQISLKFLEDTTNEYGYFECLFILSWKRKNHTLSFPQANSLDKLKDIFIYQAMIPHIKEMIEAKLEITFSEQDYDYLYLAYCCTNSCVLADKWTPEDIAQVHEIVFSDEKFKKLLGHFGSQFGPELEQSQELRSVLVYFYKKCLLNLQCIIPDLHYYLNVHGDPLVLMVKEQVKTTLHLWKEENAILYPIDKGYISYLALQITAILRKLMKPIQVIAIADSTAELEVMNLYLSRTYPENRIIIRTILINAQNLSFLQYQKNSVIIVKKSFEEVVHFLRIPADCILVLTNIDIHDSDQLQILDAIITCEKKAFTDFLDNKRKKQLSDLDDAKLLKI